MGFIMQFERIWSLKRSRALCALNGFLASIRFKMLTKAAVFRQGCWALKTFERFLTCYNYELPLQHWGIWTCNLTHFTFELLSIFSCLLCYNFLRIIHGDEFLFMKHFRVIILHFPSQHWCLIRADAPEGNHQCWNRLRMQLRPYSNCRWLALINLHFIRILEPSFWN